MVNTFVSKYEAASLAEKKTAECGWFEAESDWCVSWSGTERYWLTMALISGADVSMSTFEPQEDIFHIHRDINQPKTLLTVIN